MAKLAKGLASARPSAAGCSHHDIRGGLHGSLDLYPAVVRILTIAVEYLELYWPITHGKKAMLLHPRPEQGRLYAYLRPRLEWTGSGPESYRIIDRVVAALIAALSLRDIEFLPPGRDGRTHGGLLANSAGNRTPAARPR